MWVMINYYVDESRNPAPNTTKSYKISSRSVFNEKQKQQKEAIAFHN